MLAADARDEKWAVACNASITKIPRDAGSLLFLDLLDDSVVTSLVLSLEEFHVLASVSHHLDEAAARVIVLLVLLEVFRQVVDASREHHDLDIG